MAAWLVLHNKATRKVVRGDFYSTSLECLHCGWSGKGASIALPLVECSGDPVIYACPDCLEVVAVHDITSDTEILDEAEELEPKGGVLMWNIRI